MGSKPGKPECVDYFEQVLDGRIVACKRLKQLAEMMLERIENGYKDWHFDYERGNKVVLFIESFCMLPSGRLGVPFRLELFQKAIIQVMFGFVDDNGRRQFHNVLWVLGRKNGKTSTSAALLLYMLMADGEGAPQNYCAATSKAQASLAYGAALKMMRQSKALSKRLRKGTVAERGEDGIIYDANSGYITPLTNQTRHLDGLDVHFALFDELAACTNRDQYDLLDEGMAARDEPMMLCITTNGFERGNIFDDRYDYGCGILDGKISDDRFLPIIYELDSRDEWTDESCWLKANPGLGPIKKLEALRDHVNEAMQNPSKLPSVLTKDFNVPENRAAAWLKFEEAVCEETFDISEMGFRYGVAGFDASDTTDLSSATIMMMRPGDDRIYELKMNWLPEDSLRDDGLRTERDDVPYRLWEKKGLLRLVPGNKVPKQVFLDWLEEVKETYDVWCFAIGYDPWHIIGTDETNLQQYVGKDRAEVIRQGVKTLSDPMKQIRADFAANRMVDNHNPLAEWARMNVSVKQDVNANVQPVKLSGKAKNRIDPFMSELFAYIALIRHYDEYMAII